MPRTYKPKTKILLDWQEELRNLLIEGGTDGVKQRYIVKRFDHWIDGDVVYNELLFLETQHKVQRFTTHGRGRPATIWRATTEILKP